MEDNFKLQYAFPNPISTNTECSFTLKQGSRVKLFLNDSLFLDINAHQGTNTMILDLNNYPSGCYKIKAECYLGQTENSPISNKILKSSGRVMVIQRPKS